MALLSTGSILFASPNQGNVNLLAVRLRCSTDPAIRAGAQQFETSPACYVLRNLLLRAGSAKTR